MELGRGAPGLRAQLLDRDEVVIVEGEVQRVVADAVLVDEYERKYAYRADPGEGWYRVVPRRVLAWTEPGYPRDATRFDF